ncbi:MAG: hypothetical protein KBF17_13010 [Candidatus Promineofilum sp.]|nr:hypothetical protein [Promineifilum sp.]
MIPAHTATDYELMQRITADDQGALAALSPELRERLPAWATESADPTNDQQGNNE